MKKVLLINSLGVGGAEKVITSVANHLIKDNVAFDLLALLNINDYYSNKDKQPVFLSQLKSINIISFIYLFYKFLSYGWKEQVTLVQSHLFWSNYINILSKPFLSHTSQLVHCVSFESKYQRGMKRFVHYHLSRTLFNKADINIFKSEEMRDEYIHLFNINMAKTKVIYNPVKIQCSSLESAKSEKKKYFNVCLVGRFHSSKRYDDLVDVASKCYDHIVFHCIGDGSEREKVEIKVRSLGLEHKVIFHGWLEDPSELLLNADLYLSFSESEGFPNSLIEAMSLGLVCLHSECKTGPKEILGSVLYNDSLCNIREFGITFPVGNTDSVVKFINKFDTKYEFMGEYSKLAKKRAEYFQNFNSLGEYKKIFCGAEI